MVRVLQPLQSAGVSMFGASGHMGPFNMVDGREQALEAAMAQRAKAQAEADKTKRQGPRRGSSKTSIYSTM